jgi:hypothetical protein
MGKSYTGWALQAAVCVFARYDEEVAMRGRVGTDNAAMVVDVTLPRDVSPKSAEDRRLGKTIWLRREVYVELARRARTAGVTFGAYIENALLKMRTPLAPTAMIATPLAQVSHRLAQITESLDSNDFGAVRTGLIGARDIIAQALLPLRRDYAREACDLARHDDDWTG